MAYQNGIIGVNPDSGKTIISYNGVRFYTQDKSVIAMAERGNIAGAAKRYIGKSSTASALRQANRNATKPIYENVAQSLFNKIFRQKDKNRLQTDQRSMREFVQSYRETIKTTELYIDQAIKSNIGISEYMDRLPAGLKERVNNLITEEVEKAYSEKGQVENSDLSRISNRIHDMLEDYVLSGELEEGQEYLINEMLDSVGIETEGLVKV